MKPKNYISFIIPIAVAIFNILIILFPTQMIAASRQGLGLWFNNVLPSLLPFIIGTNILVGLGFVSFLGTLLEPVMRPVFGVPGCGGFALITGMMSGYPMGAKTVSDLKQKNLLSKTEAQRLVGFVNNSGPLFMLGAVGVSMFNSKAIGYFFMFSHYISAIVTGVVMKYYKYEHKTEKQIKSKNTAKNALNSMKIARNQDGRSLGQILGDSVRNAMETILVVGGFIILFCVIVEVLEITNVVGATNYIFSEALSFFGISDEVYKGFFVGIMEITNGTKIISETVPSKAQLLAAVSVLSFGGFSIHAQAISFLHKADINPFIYIASKALHSLISVVVASILFPFFKFKPEISAVAYSNKIVEKLAFSSVNFVASIAVMFIVVLIFYFWERD